MLKYQEKAMELLDTFQIVLLSETIPNRETEELLERTSPSNVIVLQIVEKIPEEEELLKKQEQGINYFLPKHASLEEVRELLSFEGIGDFVTQSKHSSSECVSITDKEVFLSKLSLTPQEQKLLQELIRVKGKVLSRKELCQQIWNKELTNSTQSQLSFLIKKIKRKIEDANLDSSCIKTLWGKGYSFDDVHLTQNKREY
ncbi:winged helix-turn-helix domain-containing protein [Candidatus Enterococcus murrayae]|uniref:Winged helix-turn-helix domain-containing protein n=1 Tax=Candidatus Enterococcus murrayae TaxID=2815321 RepID=A0ABS3HLE5_9ENTE|nr:winged helix-turn-helix domain-containing protein [Enterococcus sp. MJM16]MBO0454267.1 winged helix-turn-helix domain-containing protein [Enterococcus sp. MJM16]